MVITVFGATGGTGRHLVDQALAAGHDVRAVVRDPTRLPSTPGRLFKVIADVFDPVAIEPAVEGSDAVISALDPRKGSPELICSTAVDSITTAMRATGVKRLIAISASPVAPVGKLDDPVYRFLLRPAARAMFRKTYADLTIMELNLAATNLAWTVVQPPRLTDKPATGRYRTAIGRTVSHGRPISRADLATAMLRAIDDVGTVGATVGVAY
jgi:putative NADH-flavin reductase